MAERELVCGRDVLIVIDGRRMLQAEKAELRRISELDISGYLASQSALCPVESLEDFSIHSILVLVGKADRRNINGRIAAVSCDIDTGDAYYS